MFDVIKTKLQDINNRVNFGITNIKGSNGKFYFVEIINLKREAERHYVDQKEFKIFIQLNTEKLKLLEKLRAKQKKLREAIKKKKKQDKIDAEMDADPIEYEDEKTTP